MNLFKKHLEKTFLIISSIFVITGLFLIPNSVEIDDQTYTEIHSLLNSNKSCLSLKEETCRALKDNKIGFVELYYIKNEAKKCNGVSWYYFKS